MNNFMFRQTVEFSEITYLVVLYIFVLCRLFERKKTLSKKLIMLAFFMNISDTYYLF